MGLHITIPEAGIVGFVLVAKLTNTEPEHSNSIFQRRREKKKVKEKKNPKNS